MMMKEVPESSRHFFQWQASPAETFGAFCY